MTATPPDFTPLKDSIALSYLGTVSDVPRIVAVLEADYLALLLVSSCTFCTLPIDFENTSTIVISSLHPSFNSNLFAF